MAAVPARDSGDAPVAPTPRARREPRRRWWRGAIAVAFFVAIVLPILWTMGVIGGNVREVDPGRFYRSAQLTDGNLEGTMRRYGIRSVVNLRGAQPEAGFYRSEMEVCRELGAQHRDVALSAYALPPPGELTKVLAAFDELPRPILIHCRAGSDRTGLVATLYETVVEGRPLDAAQADQLTWRYGHFAFSRSRAMDRFFDLYRRTSGGRPMRAWIGATYPGLYARFASRRVHGPISAE